MRSRILAGALLGTALIGALTGCSTPNGTGKPKAAASPSASPSPKPAEVLAAAATRTAGVPLKVELTGDTADDNVAGSYDGTHGIGAVSGTSGTDRMNIVDTAQDMYLSGLSDLQGKILHLRIAKILPKSPMGFLADLTAPLTLLTGVTDVTSAAPLSFSGTLDLTKVQAATVGARKFVECVTTAASGSTGGVKFTATVNAQGYLTDFNATLPNNGDFTVKYSDFGSPVSVAKPSGENVVEAPEEMYAAQ